MGLPAVCTASETFPQGVVEGVAGSTGLCICWVGLALSGCGRLVKDCESSHVPPVDAPLMGGTERESECSCDGKDREREEEKEEETVVKSPSWKGSF